MQSRVRVSEMPWMSTLAEDQKFRKVVTSVLVAFLIMSIVVTLINLPPINRLAAPKTPPRLVKIIKPKQVVPPKPKEPTAEELAALRKAEEERRKKDEEERRKREEADKKLAEERKKQEEEERKKREKELAEKRLKDEELRKQREKDLAEKRLKDEEQRKQREAEQKRLAEERAKKQAEERARAEAARKEQEKAAARKAAQDVFGGLSDSVGTTPSAVTAANAPLTVAAAGEQAAAPVRGPSKTLSSSTATAGKRSGGIDTSSLAAVDTGVSATLGARSTAAVEEIDLGIAGGGAGGGADSEATTTKSGQPSRSARELNEIMERYKGRMGQLYQAALRNDPSLGGKIVARITILPSGEVSDVELSGDVSDAKLLSRLRALIKTIDFGSKDVPTVVANYPIDFAML